MKFYFVNKCIFIRWIKEEYNNVDVYITENGFSDDGQFDDTGRIEYLREHLQQIMEAVVTDECNLKGYTGTFSVQYDFKIPVILM